MIRLKPLIKENNKKSFVGDCRTISDNTPIFSDATEMAQCVDNGINITYQEFLNQINLSWAPKNFKLKLRTKPNNFEFAQTDNLLWAYDKDLDIHYFFM